MSLFTTQHISQKISVFIITLLLLPVTLSAAENEVSASSRSISYALSSEPALAEKQAQLRQTEVKSFPALQKQGFRNETGSAEKFLTNVSFSASGDFTIYSVSTDLLADLDFDGFYHQFSLSIDVDTIYSSGAIYTRLYLSYEGGPWNEYASSDTYIINGDSSLDTFVIETELTEGYPAGYYDIRIALYDAGTDEWLLSYGPYENSSLSALPLEDNYNDGLTVGGTHGIETDIIITSAGSMSGWLLAIPGLLVAGRRFNSGNLN
ncbi:hypothetical protein MNBD_GAMMA10-131 [hydrothermal vent metagenome]|uniref:Uncharacterized protein n=1 Tax=hydrothermal vent metagenome TaxID=652676 RepID=A0A3B0XQR2_9ZZZZ